MCQVSMLSHFSAILIYQKATKQKHTLTSTKNGEGKSQVVNWKQVFHKSPWTLSTTYVFLDNWSIPPSFVWLIIQGCWCINSSQSERGLSRFVGNFGCVVSPCKIHTGKGECIIGYLWMYPKRVTNENCLALEASCLSSLDDGTWMDEIVMLLPPLDSFLFISSFSLHSCLQLSPKPPLPLPSTKKGLMLQ